jgi:hypothetical protein
MGILVGSSDEIEAGEEIVDLEGGAVGSIGAVRAIVADAGAEIASNGARGGFFRIGGAHGVTPLLDGALGFKDHGEDFAGAHEVGELAEERALAMNGVEAACFLFGEAHGLDCDDLEAGFVYARKNLALLAAADGIGLDNCECPF